VQFQENGQYDIARDFTANGDLYLYDIISSPDGYTLLGGHIDENENIGYSWIMRIDREFNSVWRSNLRNQDRRNHYSNCVLTEAGFIVVGWTNGQDGFANAYLVGTNEIGEENWEQIVGGESHDGLWSIASTGNASFVTAGMTYSFGAQERDAWLFKFRETENSIEPDPAYTPSDITLNVFPNPFNSRATVVFAPIHWGNAAMNSGKQVSLLLIDPLGRVVRDLAPAGWMGTGREVLTLDGSALPAGWYQLHLQAGGQAVSKAIVIEK